MSDLTSLSKLSTRDRGWSSRNQAPWMEGSKDLSVMHSFTVFGGRYGA